MNDYHAANRKGWEAISPRWQAKIDQDGIWPRVHQEPSLFFQPQELAYLENIAGQSVCVLGSGDNLAVFALAGLEARVTSVDISQSQLDIADQRALKLGLDDQVSFVRSDVTDLGILADDSFDLVYTGGHVAVWVSDLNRYYAEAVRVLKPGGLFIVTEYHPFRRIWHWDSEDLVREFHYFDRGPHQYDRAEGVPEAEPGSLPSYEFNWTVSDYVQAVMEAGCTLVALDEFGDQRQDWEGPDLTGLPEHLFLVGRKA